MCKRLIWGLPLWALVIGVSPVSAWPHQHGGQSYQYTRQTVQSYQYAPLAVQSYQFAPAAVQSYQYAPLAVQSYQYAPLAAQSYQYTPLAAQSYQYIPLAAQSYQYVPLAANAQSFDLLGLLDNIRRVTDLLGGLNGGGGGGSGSGGDTTGLAARVSRLETRYTNQEKRISTIESTLKLKKKPSTSSGRSGLSKQFHADAEAVDDSTDTEDDPIQTLVDLITAQNKALRPALRAIDLRIQDTQDQLDYLTDLKKRLPQPMPAPKRGAPEVAPAPKVGG